MSKLLARTGFASALRHRDLRLLLGGLVVSTTGSWAYNVVLVAYVFDRTHSLGWVSAAGLGRFLPALLLSAYSGVIAERVERVSLMVRSDVLCMIFQGLLAITAALDGPVVLAILLAALTSTANVVYNPAVGAMIPQLAGEDDLAAASALESTIENLVIVAGPAIGAGLLVAGSPALAFAFNAASFGCSALLVSRISVRSRTIDVTEAGEAGPLQQMAVGLRAVVSSAAVAVPVAFTVVASFVYGADTVILLAFSKAQLGSGTSGYGYLLAGAGVGGLLAAAAVNRLAAAPRLGAIIAGGITVYCLPSALMTLVHSPLLAFALQVVRGAGTLVVDVLAVIVLQRATAPELLARVFGVFWALIIGAIALGALVGAPLVDGLGLHGALLAVGLGIPALALCGYPVLVRLDRASLARVAELAPRVAVLERLQIFAAAGQPVLERVAAACSELSVAAGTAIVREGEHADALYVVLDGVVEVWARGETGGADRQVATLGPDSYFGEIGLLERIPRTATVLARVPARLYRIGGDEFLDALTSSPPAASLIEDVRARLARTRPSHEPTYAGPAGPGVEALER